MKRVHTKTIEVEVSYVYYSPRHRRPLIQVSKGRLSMPKQWCFWNNIALEFMLDTWEPLPVEEFLVRNSPTLSKIRKGGKSYPIPIITEDTP